jgi:hypothetical protein
MWAMHALGVMSMWAMDAIADVHLLPARILCILVLGLQKTAVIIILELYEHRAGMIAVAAMWATLVVGLYVVDPPLPYGDTGAYTSCNTAGTVEHVRPVESAFIHADSYHGTYHGVTDSHLSILHDALRERAGDGIIFLAGDSSLDNKYWLASEDRARAPRGYRDVLRPARMARDVNYWLNYECEKQGRNMTALMTAVEESSLRDRDYPQGRAPLRQDRFIRDHLTADDVLVVSVGGNDIALTPSVRTIVAMAGIAYVWPQFMVAQGIAPGMAHLRHLFKTQIEAYVAYLVGTTRPRAVVVCMIYHPSTDAASPSWANMPLGALGYNRNPRVLHTAIAALYRDATSQICIPGHPSLPVLPLALAGVLDGSVASDYVSRVEPSATGGHKMALAILRCIKR